MNSSQMTNSRPLANEKNRLEQEKVQIEKHFTENERFYFYINCIIYSFNIIFGLRVKSNVLVIASTVALILSIYVYNADYKRDAVWILDQLTILAILVPGVYAWWTVDKKKYPFAGILMFSAMALYIYSIFSRTLVHDVSGDVRIRWHVILHIFTTLGHVLLHSEPKLLTSSILFI